ncbi:MAG: hypothetical protein JXX28_05700 [Deltaproteobacteria bacterium]|nr:hypothetical protein [Deltaproteobacteria bacterium]
MRSERFVGRRGSSAAQFVIMLPMILAATALAIDGSSFYTARSSAQAVADAATLAASSALIGEREYTVAVDRAEQTVEVNPMFGSGFTIPRGGVEFGLWDFGEQVFTAKGPTDPEVNAVRVQVRSAPVEPVIAGLVGMSAPTAGASAIAVAITGNSSTHGCGMIGDGNYEMNGNPKVDSYALADGAYGGSNIGHDGNTCSNGDFTIMGSVDVWGTLGYGDTLDDRGHAYRVDELFHMDEDVEVAQVDCADARTTNDNALVSQIVTGTTGHGSGTFTGTYFDDGSPSHDTTITIPGGTQEHPKVYYLEDFNVGTKIELSVTGAVVFCVDGDVNLQARAIVNSLSGSGDPRDFVIQVDSTETTETTDHHGNVVTDYSANGEVTFHANTATYAVIQAPGSIVNYLGNAQFYGVLIGGDVDHQGNADIHIPEELAGEFAPLPEVTMVRLVR